MIDIFSEFLIMLPDLIPINIFGMLLQSVVLSNTKVSYLNVQNFN